MEQAISRTSKFKRGILIRFPLTYLIGLVRQLEVSHHTSVSFVFFTIEIRYSNAVYNALYCLLYITNKILQYLHEIGIIRVGKVS